MKRARFSKCNNEIYIFLDVPDKTYRFRSSVKAPSEYPAGASSPTELFEVWLAIGWH